MSHPVQEWSWRERDYNEVRLSAREAPKGLNDGATFDRVRNYAVSRARPLARRRAMTLRPFFVLIRFRNPCSRFRFSFEGC
jgi:hypothetical protein